LLIFDLCIDLSKCCYYDEIVQLRSLIGDGGILINFGAADRGDGSYYGNLVPTKDINPQMEVASNCRLVGMLQDFSLDPLAIRQVHTVAGVTSGRWNWLIDPATTPNILGVPEFNFPGWMLIMLYGTT
jgi:hypothetical protein